MVVVRVGTHLPLVHLASAPLGLDAVLGGEMLGEEHVPLRLAPAIVENTIALAQAVKGI